MGRVGLPVCGVRHGRAVLAPGAILDAHARVTGRCYVGRGAQVGPYAMLGEGAVIGRGASIGRGARVEHSCIGQNAAVPQWQVVRRLMIVPQAGNLRLAQIMPYGTGRQ